MTDDLAGSVDDVTDAMYERGASDGLPVVPPTEDRVSEMLACTTRSPESELCRLGNREGILTANKLAVNGVMAGCIPLHMPVLEAGARALADPAANAIQSSVSTGSWAYFFLVNGPIRTTLDINSGTGAFGPGFRSNRTIGRALGMAYRNTARIHPGEKDMGVQGNPFKYSLVAGENEAESPWEPYHVEHGYEPTENTVTLSAPNSFLQHAPDEMTPEGVLGDMVYNTPPQMIGIETESFRLNVFHSLCPFNAQELDALTKQEVKEYIYANSHRSREQFSPGGGNLAAGTDQIEPLQRRQFDSPERIEVVVIGGSGRFDAVMGPTLGGPTTKEIELPRDWDNLVERYRERLDRNWGVDRPDASDGS